MAKSIFFLQSDKSPANIYIRFSIENGNVLKRKTGFLINPKDWKNSSVKKRPKAKSETSTKNKLVAVYKPGLPNDKSAESRNLKADLSKMSDFIGNAYNKAVSLGLELNGDWLQDQIDICNNKKPVLELDILLNYIQKYIDEAPYKKNQKGKFGLSTGRVQNLKLFKNTIERYQNEVFRGKRILIKDINMKFVEEYKLWLFKQNYSVNYVGKNIANIKTMCFDAIKNNIETSSNFKDVKGISEKKESEQIIILTEAEQDKIKNATLLREALINARKWLLLGCEIGQRAGDLLSITKDNIVINDDQIKVIRLTQQKTGKPVEIPLYNNSKEIVENEMPYKISLARFNEYIKDICEIAEINEMITAKIKVKSKKPMELKTLEKFNFITSHVCRRSFASNFYGVIPTPLLMKITQHSTERMFLTYVGKTNTEYTKDINAYFTKLKPIEKTAQLQVVREAK